MSSHVILMHVCIIQFDQFKERKEKKIFQLPNKSYHRMVACDQVHQPLNCLETCGKPGHFFSAKLGGGGWGREVEGVKNVTEWKDFFFGPYMYIFSL